MTSSNVGERAGAEHCFAGVSMGSIVDPVSPVPPREIYRLIDDAIVLAAVGFKTCAVIGDPVSPDDARDLARSILARASAATPSVLLHLALALEAVCREREAERLAAMEVA